MTRTRRSLTVALQVLLLTVTCGSSLLSAQGRDRTPPTAPTNLVVTGTTENSITLSWGPSTDNSGRFTYVICCAGTTVTVSQATTTHTLTGLQSGKTYTIRAYAKDAAGNLSNASNAVSVTLPGVVAAPTTPAVQLVNVGPTHVSLAWSSADDGPIIWFTIYVDGEPVSTLNSLSTTIKCAAVLVATGCVPIDQETTYTLTVRARDVDGNWSPMSDPVVVTTQPANPNDQAAPTQPSNITAEDLGGHLLLSWDASTDDFAPQSLIRYDVYVNGELRAVVVGSTSVEVEGDPGGSLISIVAVDTADNESEPGTISVGL